MARERRPASSRGHLIAHAYHSLRMQQFHGQPDAGSVFNRSVAAELDRLTADEARFVRALAADEHGEPGCLVEIIERRFGPFDYRWSPYDDDDDPPLLRVVPESHPPTRKEHQ